MLHSQTCGEDILFNADNLYVVSCLQHWQLAMYSWETLSVENIKTEHRDVNKDLTPKDQDKDILDLTPQGQGPDPQGPGQGLEICP